MYVYLTGNQRQGLQLIRNHFPLGLRYFYRIPNPDPLSPKLTFILFAARRLPGWGPFARLV